MSKTVFQQALKDYKSASDVLLETAKLQLLEGNEGYLQQKLEQKLQEIADEDEELDEEFDLSAIVAEEEDEAEGAAEDESEDEAAAEDAGAEIPSFEDGDAAPEGDGELDLAQTLADTSLEDLSALIDAAIQKAIGNAAGGNTGEEVPVDVTTDMGADAGMGDPAADEAPVADPSADMAPDFGDEDDDNVDEDLARLLAEVKKIPVRKQPINEVAQLKAQIADLKKANAFLSEKLNENKLWNARLLYFQKLVSKTQLSEDLKLKIAKRLDKASTLAEAKTVYETLKETIDSGLSRQTKPLNESFGGASRSIGSTQSTPQPDQQQEWVKRFQKLAGIK